jgi:hypothetical protein
MIKEEKKSEIKIHRTNSILTKKKSDTAKNSKQ